MDLLKERIKWAIAGAAALLAAALFFTKPWDYYGSDEPELRVEKRTADLEQAMIERIRAADEGLSHDAFGH